MNDEALPRAAFGPIDARSTRECGSKRRWLARYPEISIFALRHGNLAAIVLP